MIGITIFIIKLRVVLTSVSGTLFKDFKKRNYFIEKSKISISDALITHTFIINYYSKTLISIRGNG